EAERCPAASYPHSDFPEPLSWLVDEERRAAFEEGGNHFESCYHLTLQYLPPEESRDRAAKLIYENTSTAGVDWHERLTAFIADTTRIFCLLAGLMRWIGWLADGETLCFLHTTVSIRRQRVDFPELPYHLDMLLTVVTRLSGLALMLGDEHQRETTLRGFST